MSSTDVLSPEQEVLLERWYDEWLGVALSTEPADRPEAEAAVAGIYREAGEEPPALVWCDSPRAASEAWEAAGRPANHSGIFERRYRLLRPDSIFSGLSDTIRGRVGMLWRRLDDALEGIDRAIRDGVERPWSTYYGAQADASWLAYSTFSRQVGGVLEEEDRRQMALWEAAARCCGRWWAYEGLCLLCERPVRLGVEPCEPEGQPGHRRLRLHASDDPAVQFPDGAALWFWHGVRVDRAVIEAPDTLTAEDICREGSFAVRAVMLVRFGLERFLRDCGTDELDRDMDAASRQYRLLRVPLEEAWEEEVLAIEITEPDVGVGGKPRHWVVAVHPDVRPLLLDGSVGAAQIRTCVNALASTFGLQGEEYAPMLET